MLLRSADAMIRFESDVGGILKEVLDLLPAHVPLTGSYDEYGSADYMFVVKDGLPSVNINRNTITYTGEVDTSLFSLDIVCLLSSLFEHIYVSKDLFSLHSSAVQGNEGAILFVGPAGCGKTTTAVYLGLNHNYKFASGDRTLINSAGQIVAGTKNIVLRKRSLYEEFNISKYCGSSWEDSENMLPQDLNIRDASLPDKIGGIYFPRKTGGEIISEELSKPDLLFRLYQASAYFDELHMPVLYGLNRIVPRINAAADSRNKLKLVSAFANKFKAEAISGRLNEICKYVQGGE